MAYLVSIKRPCQTCGKNATCEVRNSHNASIGAFCGPCGKRRVKELERAEKAGGQ